MFLFLLGLIVPKSFNSEGPAIIPKSFISKSNYFEKFLSRRVGIPKFGIKILGIIIVRENLQNYDPLG